MKQQEMILRHLKSHKRGITSRDAIEKYGCTRLSGVIFQLKKKGYNISSEREYVATRYGHASIARYFLEA